MSYQEAKQIVSGKIPPWQKVLGTASDIIKEGKGFSKGFSNAYTFGASELASNMGKNLGESIVPLSSEKQSLADAEYNKIVNPETSGAGEALGFGTGAFGQLAVNAPKALGKLASNLEIGKVKKIQQAFGPWVKGYTSKYGKSFKKGIRDVIKGGNKEELIKEVQRIFNPLRRSDGFKDLPSKTQSAVEKVYRQEATTRDVLNAGNRVRKYGAKLDETGNLARETTGKLKNIVKKESKEFAKADKEYGPFSGTKRVMEKFKPGLKGQGEFGTQAGTKLLRNIKTSQPGDIAAMERFGKETGIDIVGPAKAASTARGVGQFLKKSAPIAFGLGAGGSAAFLAAKKYLMGNGGYNGYPE